MQVLEACHVTSVNCKHQVYVYQKGWSAVPEDTKSTSLFVVQNNIV